MYRLIRQAVYLLIAAGAVDCAVAAGDGEAPGSVRIAASHWTADAPTKVADALGYFNRGAARPEIRITSYNSGKEALASMLAGESELALATSTPIASTLLDWWNASERDPLPPLLVLAAVTLVNQTHVVVGDAATGIEKPSDLAGRRIAVMLGTAGHFGWTEFARFHDIGDAEVTLVDLPASRHRAHLLDGDVSAAVLWDPWASQLATSLGRRARVFDTRHLYTVNWLLVARPDVLTGTPGLDSRVLTAYRDAIEFIDENPERARNLHDSSNIGDTPTLRTTQTGFIYRLGIDWAVVADLEVQLRWFAERRDQPAAATPAPYRYLYAAPLRRIESHRVTFPGYFFVDDLSPAGKLQ